MTWGVIERVLPRRTSFERWRGRSRGERQVLAANVDAILIVQPLGAGELLLGRVARSLVLARDCGLEPVVVLTQGGPARRTTSWSRRWRASGASLARRCA